MIRSLRNAFNQNFTAEKYQAFLKDLDSLHPGDIEFRVSTLPVFVDKDYAEGLTEETLDESNRKIYRTIIKKSNTTDVFSKVVYNWGGVYFFKNTTSMSESNYNNELRRYKEQLGK